MPVVLGGSASAVPAAPSKSRRILVVDDNVDSARCLATLMRRWGHSVQVAHTGDEALRAAEACPPDAALLDIHLPDMSGNEVARRLRGAGGSTELQVIGVSGSNREAVELADFHHYLMKPIDSVALEQLLATRVDADSDALTSLKPR